VTPRQLLPGDDPAPVLALVRASFAYMDGRIDPPSSMHRLSEDDIARLRLMKILVDGGDSIGTVATCSQGESSSMSAIQKASL